MLLATLVIAGLDNDDYDINDFTKITFTPDRKYFNFDEDVIQVLKKKVFDIAAVSEGSYRVYLNGEDLKIKSFKEKILENCKKPIS